ncbi:hypothetical protein [Shewanella baltica]|uniref:hypothetical protein n=1 Tax=Shewanella baltica TaxID=62322 RepID=UPI003D79A04F
MDLKSGLIVSVLVSLSVIVTPLLFYWCFIGKDQIISPNHEDWAFFGSFLAGIYTAIASFGSVGTLIFLIYQNYAGKEIQDRLILAKVEMLGFEKYQTHRLLFDKLIVELETTETSELRVIDRYELYKNIFPHNSLESCSYKVKLEEQDENHPLVEALAVPKKLIYCFNSTGCSDEAGREIVQYICDLQDFLNIRVFRPVRDCDFIHRPSDSVILNASELEVMVSALWKFTNNFFEFTGNEPTNNVSHMVGTSFVIKSISNYADLAKTSRNEKFMLHQEI